jgi:hypothetical protein
MFDFKRTVAALTLLSSLPFTANATMSTADIIARIQRQTPVKTQDKQSVCSVFSTLAQFEYEVMRRKLTDKNKDTLDLSEAWLIYITAGQKGKFGSYSTENIEALDKYGYVYEQDWVFNPQPWSDIEHIRWYSPKILQERCRHTQDTAFFTACLVGQRDPRHLSMNSVLLGEMDPDFLPVREFALGRAAITSITAKPLKSKARVQEFLNAGYALTLDVPFFYEAWNHRRVPELGLERDMGRFEAGIVTAPVEGSADYITSRGGTSTPRSGHSVLVVGYDNSRVLERNVKMADGSYKLVRTQGVYYFKNSWGTESFGKNFELGGQNFPGYGMIAMDYAKLGKFTAMEVKANR